MTKKTKNKKWYLIFSSLGLATIITTPLIAAACAKRMNEIKATDFYVDKNQKYFINSLVEINEDQTFENLKQAIADTKFEIFVYDTKQQKTTKTNDLVATIEKQEKTFANKKVVSLYLALDQKPTKDYEYVIVANKNIKSIKITMNEQEELNIKELVENNI